MQGVMRTTQDLGLMVHGVRTGHQPTQAELAVRLGVSRRYLSELETGRPKVPNAKLLSVLDQLGVVRRPGVLNPSLGKLLGLTTFEGRLQRFGDRLVLIIERCDRNIPRDKVARIHQEDAAQALSLLWNSDAKFEAVD